MRTFEDIIPPSRRPERPAAAPGPGPKPRSTRPKSRFPYLTVLIASIVIIGSAVALVHFSTAKIEIVPTASSVAVANSFSAGGTSDLPIQIATATKTDKASLPASGSKPVTTSASGPITIYNTQTKPQKLIANTRFATQAGLIFRIHSAVTVPSGSSSAPGTVVATAYADQPGPTYNVDPASFTVPGLAGTPQANTVYARSAAAMSGGASGTQPVVDASAKQSAITALEGSLASELVSAVEVPDGYVLLPGASVTTYRELPLTAGDTSGQASVQIEGTITAVLFPGTSLAKTIAATLGSTDGGSGPVTLGSGTTLSLTSSGPLPSANTDPFAFNLSGTASLISSVDPLQIASAVAGKSRSEAQVALTNYPEVKRATLILRPFWRQNFPEDPASIQVTVSSPDPAGS